MRVSLLVKLMSDHFDSKQQRETFDLLLTCHPGMFPLFRKEENC